MVQRINSGKKPSPNELQTTSRRLSDALVGARADQRAESNDRNCRLDPNEFDPEDVVNASTSVEFTIFSRIAASPADTVRWRDVSWGDFVASLTQTEPASAKANLPLVSFCRYGDHRTEKNSLRHADNVQATTGCEGDYDAGEVPIHEAAALLQAAGIAAVLYTSPRHTPEKPRWRVIALSSAALPPSQRLVLVGRLNAVLGGILAEESFRLSQSFYIGRVMDAPYEVIETTGRFVDKATEIVPKYPSESSAKRDKKPAAPVVFTEDSQTDVQRAITYLQSCAAAVEGARGDEQTYKTACKLRDMGLSEAVAYNLMQAFYNPRCLPPWDTRGLQTKVASAYRNAQNPRGVDSDTAAPIDNGALSFFSVSDDAFSHRRLKPTPFVVDGILPQHVGVLNAQGGSGKSTLILYVMVCIVLGRRVFSTADPDDGFEVLKPGVCVFVSKEDGGSEAWYRIQEICHAMHLTAEELEQVRTRLKVIDMEDTCLTLIELDQRHNIVETELVGNLIDLLRSILAVSLVVFDPRAMFGASENALNANEVRLATVARKISRALECAVIFVGHVSQNAARDRTEDQYAGRGGTAQADNSRFVWNLVQPKEDDKSIPIRFQPFAKHGWVSRLSYPKISYGPRPPATYVFRNLAQAPFTFEFGHQAELSEAERIASVEGVNSDRLKRVLRQTHELDTNGERYAKTVLRTRLRELLGYTDTSLRQLLEQAVGQQYLRSEKCGKEAPCRVTDAGRRFAGIEQ